jgi:hypothetical protein
MGSCDYFSKWGFRAIDLPKGGLKAYPLEGVIGEYSESGNY